MVSGTGGISKTIQMSIYKTETDSETEHKCMATTGERRE